MAKPINIPLRDNHAATRKPPAFGLLAFIFIFLAGVILTSSATQYNWAIGLMCLALAVSVSTLAAVVTSPYTRPVTFMALLYMVSFYIVPGIVHLRTGRFPFFNRSYSEDVATIGASVVLVFSVVFAASMSLAGFRSARPVCKEYFPRFNGALPSIVLTLSLSALSVLAGLAVGYEYLQVKRGALAEMMITLTPSVLILSAIARISSFLAVIVAILSIIRFRNILAWALLLASLVPFLMANSPLAIPRFILGSYLITALFVFTKPGPALKAALVAGVLVAQFTLFPFMSDISRGGGSSSFRFDPVTYVATHGDFDGYQSTLNVVSMLNDNGPAMGRQLGSAALFFVPREFFPSKSAGTGRDAARAAGYRFTNISAPLPSEFFVDFSWAGLLLLTCGLGFLVVRIDGAYEAAASSGDRIRKLIPALVAGYVMILFRGSLVAVLGPFVLSIGIGALVATFLLARPSST